MSLTLLSPLIVVSFAAAIVLLERRFPYNPQPFLRQGLLLDLFAYGLAQSYVLGLVIATIIGWVDGATGLSHRGLISGWPIWAQCLFFLVTHDFYIYCFHRFMHSNRWFWRLHEAHHSVREVDWIAGSRSHSLEILINQTIEFLPIVLLGAAPEVAIFKVTIGGVWGMWIHCNVDVRTGVLQYFLNGPEMHRWHHAADDRNFATKLAFWDWIFGTGYNPGPGHKASGYGLKDPFPEGWFRQHIAAFRTLGTSPQNASDTTRYSAPESAPRP